MTTSSRLWIRPHARFPKTKPSKPYPSFPMTAHPNGQWCKKIRGKVHFFDVWAEPDNALKRYRDLAPDLHAGRTPRNSKLSGEGLTVKDLCNTFLNWQQSKMGAGDTGPRWYGSITAAQGRAQKQHTPLQAARSGTAT